MEAVAQVLDYVRQRALYEADCQVREQLDRAREALFRNDSSRCRLATTELAKCKFKLKRIRRMSESLPESLSKLFSQLIDALERRIDECRTMRRV